MFKVGEKIQCVDNSLHEEELEYGKTYTVLRCFYLKHIDYVVIKGKLHDYYCKRFKTLKDIRKEKLNKLNYDRN